jgi:prevent-host-death family protein
MKRQPPRRTGRTVGVAEFKTHCLELLATVDARGEPLTITKRGAPIAHVTPIARAHTPLRGMLRDRLTIRGDIVNVDWTREWEAAE